MSWEEIPGSAQWLPAERLFSFTGVGLVGVMGVDFVTPPYLWFDVLRPPTLGELRAMRRGMDGLQRQIAPVVRAEAVDGRALSRLLSLGFLPLYTIEDRTTLERSI